MSFKFPVGGRRFFDKLHGAGGGATKFIMFDQYYCCLLVGLDQRRLGDGADLEAEVFINGYPDDYHAEADILAGLLIDAELDRKGIKSEDRQSIEREMVNLLNPASPTRLSVAGNELLDLYAAQGFKLIQDRILPPNNLEDFLVAYHHCWYPPTTETDT